MKQLSIAVLMACVSAPAVAQASAETLSDAVASALSGNPTLLAQRQTRGIADETLEQARAAGRPTLGLSGTYATERTEVGQSFSIGGISFPQDGNSQRATAGLQMRQTLYAGGSLAAGRRAAQAGVEAAESQLAGVERDVILSVVASFVDVRRAEEEISIRQTNVDSLRKQVEAATDRFEVGEVTRTDVAQAEARAAGAVAELAAARARLASVRALYESIVGRVPVQLAEPPPPPQAPAALQDAIAEAMARNPDVTAARSAEKAASEQISVARGQYRPRFGWAANAGVQETYQDETFRDTNMGASLELSIPIYQGGLLASRTREAELAANRARFDRMTAERGVSAQVTSAWHALLAAREAATASESRVAAARIALDGAEQELAVGTRTTLDVLDQERELLDARLGLIGAQRNAYVAAHELLAAIGRLKADDFRR